MKSELEIDFHRDFSLLQSKPPITITLSAVEAWVLMSQLQLALRHPKNKGSSAAIVMKIAQNLQDELAITDVLKEVAEMGWRKEFDE